MLDKRKKEKIFISYLDDDGETINAFVNLISISENWTIIENNKNEIRLPIHRVLKIKKEVENGS